MAVFSALWSLHSLLPIIAAIITVPLYAQHVQKTTQPKGVDSLQSCNRADFTFTFNGTMEREYCTQNVKEWFKRNNTAKNDRRCLDELIVNFKETHQDNLTLIYAGCKVFCGEGFRWYSDSATRFIVWVIPVIFLLSNIQLAPVGLRRLFAIIHALGDPIDTMWSLLDKIYAWDRCARLATLKIAGPNNDTDSTQILIQRVLKRLGRICLFLFWHLLKWFKSPLRRLRIAKSSLLLQHKWRGMPLASIGSVSPCAGCCDVSWLT